MIDIDVMEKAAKKFIASNKDFYDGREYDRAVTEFAQPQTLLALIDVVKAAKTVLYWSTFGAMLTCTEANGFCQLHEAMIPFTTEPKG